jgi:hypothetical protein
MITRGGYLLAGTTHESMTSPPHVTSIKNTLRQRNRHCLKISEWIFDRQEPFRKQKPAKCEYEVVL